MSRDEVTDQWKLGDPYEQFMGRWSRLVGPNFLAWLNVGPNRRWVDVGCGTGALSFAILDQSRPASVTGIEPSDGFLQLARDRLGSKAALYRGTATEIPLEASAADVVVSGLVLNFVSDPFEAVREMARVAAHGGVVAAYVWDYSERMQMLRQFWDAAISLDDDAKMKDEGVRFPLCRADALVDLFSRAGLRDIAKTALEVTTCFSSFEDYWCPFLGGQGPAPSYVTALDESRKARLRDQIQGQLPIASDGSIKLTARAWAVRGTVAKAA